MTTIAWWRRGSEAEGYITYVLVHTHNTMDAGKGMVATVLPTIPNTSVAEPPLFGGFHDLKKNCFTFTKGFKALKNL